MVLILATDGSENARFATEFLARYPAYAGAKVICCSVFSPISAVTATANPLLSGVFGERMAVAIQDAQSRAEIAAAEAASTLSSVGFDTETVVLEGDPASKLAELSESRNADLVVFGAIGHSGLDEFLVGSVGRSLVHGAKSSILMVRSKPFVLPAGLRAFYATDLGELSAKARKHLTHLVRGKFSELEVVTVATDLQALRAVEAHKTEVEDVASEELDERQQVINWYETRLKVAQKDLALIADQVSLRVLEGDPRKALLSHATTSEADLLIVGAKSHSMISRLLLGSVSEFLVDRAPCSVMVVRP